jgi:hypothetical protein
MGIATFGIARRGVLHTPGAGSNLPHFAFPHLFHIFAPIILISYRTSIMKNGESKTTSISVSSKYQAMHKLLFFVLSSLLAAPLAAQESFSKISLSGFLVHSKQSDQFSIETDPQFDVERTVKDGVLYIMVLDQTGAVPKSSASISVNKLSYLSLHNSQLVMDAPITVDTLELALACSFGTLQVNARSLDISAGAAAHFSVVGTTQYLTCIVGAASTLSATQLIADQADLTVTHHSYLYVNAREITSSICDKGSYLKNVAKIGASISAP